MRQADTAAAVYRQDIQPTLNTRQQFVREELCAFIAQKHFTPTALELLRFMAHRYPDRYLDPNSVRPRLNEMETMGLVRHGVKRSCDVSGKTVMTWVLGVERKAAEQTGLF